MNVEGVGHATNHHLSHRAAIFVPLAGPAAAQTIGTNLESFVDESYDRQAADESVIRLEPPQLIDLTAAEARLVTCRRAGDRGGLAGEVDVRAGQVLGCQQ